jgi:amino acid transporter/mannitol/fructose-specific phosphotransferase system IIA component (Ntr-type)
MKIADGKKKLGKQIGVLGVFSISAGAMISSGLFILPGLVYAKVGPSVILAYILAGIFIIPLLFAKTELITAMPKAGGSYFFIERSMGSTAGTIGGFVSWFSLSLKSAFALVGIGAFATLINPYFTEWDIKLIAAGFCIIFTVLNLVSVDLSSKVQNIIVISLVIILIGYSLFGATKTNVGNFQPFFPEVTDFRLILSAAGMVFISFAGLTKIASVAEEVKNPVKNIPKGVFTAFIIVIILYALSVFVTTGLLDRCEFGFHIPTSDCVVGEPLTFVDGDYAHSLTPLSDGGMIVLGRVGAIAMAMAAIFAFFSTANAGIMGASRFLMAMSRDHILPDIFSRVTKRFKTPFLSIIFTGGFMVISIVGLNIETLVKVASAMTILLFIMGLISSIIMRESRILNYRPTFKTPFYPWMNILGIVIYLYLLYEMGFLPLMITIGFIIASIIWHKFYFTGKGKSRKSAIIYILERMLPKEIRQADKMTADDVYKELDKVISQTDEITEDRFEKLIKDSEFIDIEQKGEMPCNEFFEIISDKLSEKLNQDKDMLLEKFIQREKDSTTEIRPGLAVPHIVVEEKGRFDMIVVRSNSGIVFSEEMPPAYCIFVLAGSQSERYFHLKTLSLIVKLTRRPSFDRHWLKAISTDELKELVLVSYKGDN